MARQTTASGGPLNQQQQEPEPPLVIVYEAVEMSPGWWAVRRRRIRRGDTDKEIVGFFRGTSAEATERASFAQSVSDDTAEAWREVVAWMDEHRQ